MRTRMASSSSFLRAIALRAFSRSSSLSAAIDSGVPSGCFFISFAANTTSRITTAMSMASTRTYTHVWLSSRGVAALSSASSMMAFWSARMSCSSATTVSAVGSGAVSAAAVAAGRVSLSAAGEGAGVSGAGAEIFMELICFFTRERAALPFSLSSGDVKKVTPQNSTSLALSHEA